MKFILFIQIVKSKTKIPQAKLAHFTNHQSRKSNFLKKFSNYHKPCLKAAKIILNTPSLKNGWRKLNYRGNSNLVESADFQAKIFQLGFFLQSTKDNHRHIR